MTLLDDTKGILRDLIAFPTVSADSNLEMIAYLGNHLEACGARVEIFPDAGGTKANLFATLGPDAPGGLVLSGHCDVVPVADQDWSSDPFAMSEREGRLFGRGSCDMKGFLAATLAMTPRLAARDRARPIHFSFTHDEEVGCLGAQALARILQDRGIRPAMAIIGEPTEMKLVDGHKGCYEYITRFKGLEGHSSAPDLGVNAAEYAARFVTHLLGLRDQLKQIAPPGCRFDPPWTTLNVGAIQGGAAHNVIAPKAQVLWEMRPVQTSDADFVKTAITRHCSEVLVPAMQAVDARATIETETIAEVVGLTPVADNRAVQYLAGLTGSNGAGLVPFGTEAGIFQGIGMDVVICGPGSIDQAHKADEYLGIDQLRRCLDLLEKIDQSF